jgi:predicted Zn-dependent protease
VGDKFISFGLNIRGAGSNNIVINNTDDATLSAAVQRAERLAMLSAEAPQSDLMGVLPLDTIPSVSLFSEATFNVDPAHRAATARTVVQAATAAGMLSAGYIEVGAVSFAQVDSLGRSSYQAYTTAQYSVTTRDPQGTGSGWAGDSSHDWTTIDTAALAARALQKCLASRHPATVEPGRYTTILEPQAVADFVNAMVDYFDRRRNEADLLGPFEKIDKLHGRRLNKLGEKVMDERLTITADPTDPATGFPSFGIGNTDGKDDAFGNMEVYHPTTWVSKGVLMKLGYSRRYGIDDLAVDAGAPNSNAYHMTGGTTSIDEMVATTKRGIMVTRFDRIQLLSPTSVLQRGYTRDGIWLIEDGKITKAIKNFAFTESVLFALNNIEQLGVPQRVFRPSLSVLIPPTPTVVPAMKIRDFSFTSLSDAV